MVFNKYTYYLCMSFLLSLISFIFKGYYNPFARYTLQDYKNLKSNQGLAANPARFGFGSKEFDPETKTEKVKKFYLF